jgi:hypothetical protein
VIAISVMLRRQSGRANRWRARTSSCSVAGRAAVAVSCALNYRILVCGEPKGIEAANPGAPGPFQLRVECASEDRAQSKTFGCGGKLRRRKKCARYDVDATEAYSLPTRDTVIIKPSRPLPDGRMLL